MEENGPFTIIHAVENLPLLKNGIPAASEEAKSVEITLIYLIGLEIPVLIGKIFSPEYLT